jgi:hypothetical protein
VDRSLRRHGQLLVAVGAFLGALVGVVLGLAVEDPQTSTAAVAPGRARAVALAATPPSSQPAAAQPAGSGKQADGDASTGRQPTESAYRPDKGHGNAHQDNRGNREGDSKDIGSRGRGKPGKSNDNAGKGNDN